MARSAASLALGLLTLGCAQKQEARAPAYPQARTVVAQPAPTQGVFVQDAQTYRTAPAELPAAIGYETLSSGEQIVVVEYVHTYPEAVETFPHVVWSGRTYYNVHGDFVYWSDDWGWCYYLGPPRPLVVMWNGYYPWAPYAWGVGYYGAGYYWGGVGMYGYHAYGLSVAHHHHHHYAYYQTDRRPGRDTRPSAGAAVPPPSRGGPTDGGVSPGAPSRPPTRDMKASRRNPTGQGAPPPAARRQNPARMPSGPIASRRNPTDTPVRSNGYTTAGGQKITVIDPRGTTSAPGVRRNPGTSSRPTFRDPSARRRNPATPAPAFTASGNQPSRQPARARPNAPTRTNPTPAASTPSWGANYNKKPTRSNPQPTSRKPSRRNNTPSFGGSRSQPSSPGRARSNPRRSTPSRSNPARSAPRRSAPTRSAPRRSAPSRSAPKRSAPSRRSPKKK